MCWDKKLYTDAEFQRLSNEYNKIKIKCKHCGHKVVVPVWVDKQLCSWCGNYVFRNKQLEFKENVKRLMKEMK